MIQVETEKQKRNGRHLFEKGVSGNPKGKPKGAVSLKTQGWELLKESITSGLTDKFMQEMNKLEGTAYINAYLNVMEYFKPKLSRQETLNTNVELDRVTVTIADSQTITLFPSNFDEDSTEDAEVVG
jgi:hypothetical protein